MDGVELPKYTTIPHIIKGTSIAITATTTSWDIINTWTENNNNTPSQRYIKSATIVGKTAAGIGVGAIAASVVATCITGGLGFLPCFLVYAGITITDGLAINGVEDMVYDIFDIE